MSFRDSLRWTREVLRQWRHWTRANWRITLLLSLLAFVVGWAWNTYAMAVGLEGSEVPEGQTTAATADGHSGNALFWLILFTTVSAVITYAWTRGWTAFRSDVAAFPRRFAEAMSTSRSGSFAMLLWGMAVALVIATLISSAVSIVLGLALLALASTPVGVILNFALIRVWRGLCGIVAPKGEPRMHEAVKPFMVMLGEATGLLLDAVIGGWVIKLVVALGAAAVSVALARGAVRPSAAAILAVAGAVVVVQAMRVRGAYADDGGWSECITADGRPCSDLGLGGVLAWLRSDGAGHVLTRASIGGLFAALGVLLGLGLGSAAASLAHAGSDSAPQRRTGPGDRRPGRARVPQPEGGRRPDRWPMPPPPPPPPDYPAAAQQPEPQPHPDPNPRPAPRPRPQPQPRSGVQPHPEPTSGHDAGRGQEAAGEHSARAGNEPHPRPQAEPRQEPGHVYRSTLHSVRDVGHGQIYLSPSAGQNTPEPSPADQVRPIPPPSPPASGTAAHPRGNPWADLEDFMPDAPEREARPRRSTARHGTDGPGGRAEDGVAGDVDDPEQGHPVRPPVPPERP
jgi:hypothetical protein